MNSYVKRALHNRQFMILLVLAITLILLAVFFVLMFGAKGLGIIADRNTRF